MADSSQSDSDYIGGDQSRQSTRQEIFTMLFLNWSDKLKELNRATDFHVLLGFLSNLSQDSNKVTFTAADKQKLASELGVSVNYIRDTIGRLKKTGIIEGKGSVFWIDVKLFWRGSLHERQNAIRDKNENKNKQNQSSSYGRTD